jgi:hypothetical protein
VVRSSNNRLIPRRWPPIACFPWLTRLGQSFMPVLDVVCHWGKDYLKLSIEIRYCIKCLQWKMTKKILSQYGRKERSYRYYEQYLYDLTVYSTVSFADYSVFAMTGTC